MSDVIKKLSTAQDRDLKLINQWSKGGGEWCKADSFDPRVLRKLEEFNLIVTMVEVPDRKFARLTAKAARLLDETPASPPRNGAGDTQSQVRPFRGVANKTESFAASEPMEREVTHVNDDPKPYLGPFPKNQETPPPAPPRQQGGETTRGPRAPIVPEVSPPLAPPRSDREGNNDCDGDCDHAQVLALVRVMYPEIDDAAEILLRAKVIARELGK